MAVHEFKFTLTIENGESSSFGDGSPEQLQSRNAQIKYLLGQAAGIIATHQEPVPLVASDGVVVGHYEFT
jgi:hypothetical protein